MPYVTAPPPNEELDKELPVFLPDVDLINSPDPKNIVTTWIGHSTFLVQVDGVTFLTDPVWSERCSPVSFAGPKRYRPVPLALKDLPSVDFVVISHSHYDHLDRETVAALPKDVLWIVPLGLKEWFASEGITNCVELDWWQQVTVPNSFKGGSYKVTCTPTQHWSNRGLFDRNVTLWGSFVIETSSKRKIFFGGDTGYCIAFKEIGLHVGPMDLGLIPIGAYCPVDFMKYSHVSPKESVLIHLDIKAKKSIGCHWGTFILTGEPVDEPPKLLEQEVKALGLPWDCFVSLFIGETLVIDKDGRSTRRGKDPRKKGPADSDGEDSFQDAAEPIDEKSRKDDEKHGPKTSSGKKQ